MERREFPLLNRTFAIDLSDANHKRLKDAIAFIEEVLENAREVKQASRSKKAADSAPRLRGYTTTDVREWAREQGLEVPARGKIADEVVEQFIAAHPDAAPSDSPDEVKADAEIDADADADAEIEAEVEAKDGAGVKVGV